MAEQTWTEKFIARSGWKVVGTLLVVIMLLLTTIGSLAMVGYNNITSDLQNLSDDIEDLEKKIHHLEIKVDVRDQLDKMYQDKLDDHEERLRTLEGR